MFTLIGMKQLVLPDIRKCNKKLYLIGNKFLNSEFSIDWSHQKGQTKKKNNDHNLSVVLLDFVFSLQLTIVFTVVFAPSTIWLWVIVKSSIVEVIIMCIDGTTL